MSTPWLIQTIDDKVDDAVNNAHSRVLDFVFYGLSRLADHSILWHILGLNWALAYGYWWFALQLSIALGIESALTNGPIKYLFRRVRPHRDASEPMPMKVRTPITSSFPSGHATSAFTAVFVLTQSTHVAATIALFTLATMVAFSRVYVRLHHLSDVLAGVVLGTAFGIVAALFIYPS